MTYTENDENVVTLNATESMDLETARQLLHAMIEEEYAKPWSLDSMFQIERSLHRRQPTIPEWIGLHMANTDKWYYAYYFENEETIMIVDARHAQNMKGGLDL